MMIESSISERTRRDSRRLARRRSLVARANATPHSTRSSAASPHAFTRLNRRVTHLLVKIPRFGNSIFSNVALGKTTWSSFTLKGKSQFFLTRVARQRSTHHLFSAPRDFFNMTQSFLGATLAGPTFILQTPSCSCQKNFELNFWRRTGSARN